VIRDLLRGFVKAYVVHHAVEAPVDGRALFEARPDA